MNLGFEIASRDLLSMSATTCDYQVTTKNLESDRQKMWKAREDSTGSHVTRCLQRRRQQLQWFFRAQPPHNPITQMPPPRETYRRQVWAISAIFQPFSVASMALGLYWCCLSAPNFAHRRPNRAAMFATGRMRLRPTPGAPCRSWAADVKGEISRNIEKS